MPIQFTTAEISDYYRQRAPKVRQAGPEWRGPCPLHDGDGPNFAVNPQTGEWYCHSDCGRGGDIIDLEMRFGASAFKDAAKSAGAIVGRDLLAPRSTSNNREGNGGMSGIEIYEYTGEQGEPLYEVVRQKPKDFKQRRPDGKGGYIWNLKGVMRVPYRLPQVVAAQEVFLAEGEKDVHSLEALGVVATTVPGGAGGWGRKFACWFAGKDVIILPDNDEAGQRYAKAAAGDLHSVAKSVRILQLPGLAQRGDVTDWIAAGGTREELLRMVRAAEPSESAESADPIDEPPSGLPEIEAGSRPIQDVAADALRELEAANEPPVLFVRGASLARLRFDETNQGRVETLSKSTLRHRLARVARFWHPQKEEERRFLQAPPAAVLDDILAEPNWPFPVLKGVVENPLLRPDGSVLLAPGYDSATGLYYHQSSQLRVPEVVAHPSRKDLDRALGAIDEVVCDFPFAEGASRANLWALLLTPVLRPCFGGPSPMALIDAPKAGTGKSLLTEVFSLITLGRAAHMTAFTRDEDELRKRITALLMEGASVIVFDNLSTTLESGTLALALTSTTWTDRRLGMSETASLDQQATWIATGNNIRLAGDLPRRCYRIRLDSRSDKPWTGREFRHSDLRAYVREHRAEILWALLTLGRAWYAENRPPGEHAVLGSFEGWCHTIGGVLSHAGVSGFLDNQQALYEDMDDEGPEWGAFISQWKAELGSQPLRVAELAGEIRLKPSLREVLPDALAEHADGEAQRFNQRLGIELKKRRDAQFGSLRLESGGADAHSKVNRWRVVQVEEAA